MNEDDRTSDIGLFHYAVSYWEAAAHLRAAHLRTTHPDAPINFLYYHAIELLLKSYLRLKGVGLEDLKRLGHNHAKLADECGVRGLMFDDEDMEVIGLIVQEDDAMRSRYIRTGYFSRPAHEALERTVMSLTERVGGALRQEGRPVRLPLSMPRGS